ncbi:hypothetical protein [Rhizobium halophilum]|uniref:hypothetical protein n=1 Tax=Rhizobium halophilum TaxID=2846852 RepID=UPI001EFD4E8F|nr:hypothetical protein [Rhizobium halophilum]MCF6370369.1 hypothetical protein [Rhizobium halophilum]
MSSDRHFYPEILSSSDLRILHDTVRDLLEAGHQRHHERDPEQVAKIVLRLYRIGLTEQAKLTDLAALMSDQEAGLRHVG